MTQTPETPESQLRSELATLVLLRDQQQKLRIAEGNRAKAAIREGLERGIADLIVADPDMADAYESLPRIRARAGTPESEVGKPTLDALKRFATDNGIALEGAAKNRYETHLHYERRMLDIEKDIEDMVRPHMQRHPAWSWLSRLHGVGELSAALVVGYIDIRTCNTVSQLWRYSGYGINPETGLRDRPTKGQKLVYNARLKTMCWRLIHNQILLKGPGAALAKRLAFLTRGCSC